MIIIGFYHEAAILSPEGSKTFLLHPLNSFPCMSTRGSGHDIYMFSEQHDRRMKKSQL